MWWELNSGEGDFRLCCKRGISRGISRARLREVADAVVAGVVQAPQLASLSVGGAASVSDAGCLRTFTVR